MFGAGDLVFILLFLGILYFTVLLPQSREQQRRDDLIASLAKDMEVVTRSGIHGKVQSVATDTVVLEVADKVRITLDKQSVFRRVDEKVDAPQGV